MTPVCYHDIIDCRLIRMQPFEAAKIFLVRADVASIISPDG